MSGLLYPMTKMSLLEALNERESSQPIPYRCISILKGIPSVLKKLLKRCEKNT